VVEVQLDCGAPQRHLVGVRLTVAPRLDRLRLRLPAWTPGSYLIRDYVRHLEGLQAHQGGRALPLVRLTPACWELACDPTAGPIDLRYGVMAT
jgi:predicted metalloprotease with PDZ domain